MPHRFYVDSPIDSDYAELAGAEAHHARNVLRAAVGDLIVLFDGSGHEYQAEIVHLGRSSVRVRIVRSQVVDRELSKHVVIGTALPKGERQRWMIEKLVELGASRLVPLRTTRSVVLPTPSTLARLRRSVIEASKQCGRNRLMEIAEPTSYASYLELPPSGAARWIADPASDIPPETSQADLGTGVYVLIGPEGGLTDEERNRAVTLAWKPVSFGCRILRIETAAVAAMTLAAFDLL